MALGCILELLALLAIALIQPTLFFLLATFGHASFFESVTTCMPPVEHFTLRHSCSCILLLCLRHPVCCVPSLPSFPVALPRVLNHPFACCVTIGFSTASATLSETFHRSVQCCPSLCRCTGQMFPFRSLNVHHVHSLHFYKASALLKMLDVLLSWRLFCYFFHFTF